MIECATTINEKVQKDILKTQYIVCLVMLIVGILGTVAYIVLQTIFDNSLFEIMLLFAVFFGFGLVFTISTTSTIKKAGQNPFTNKYEFDADTLHIITLKGEEVVITATTKYSELYKIKETNKYLLLYINKMSVFPILKSEINESDLTEIRKLLKINTQSQEQTNSN